MWAKTEDKEECVNTYGFVFMVILIPVKVNDILHGTHWNFIKVYQSFNYPTCQKYKKGDMFDMIQLE